MTPPVAKRFEKHDKVVGIFYLALLKQILADANLPFTGYDGPEQDLNEPHKRISLMQLFRASYASLKNAPPGLGFDYGKQLNLIAADAVGQLIMSCNTLGEAFEAIRRFHVLLSICLRIECRYHGDTVAVQFHDYYPLATPSPLRWFCSEALFTSLQRQACWLTGERLAYRQIRLPYARPPHWQRYQQEFNCEISYDADCHEVSFDRAFLQQPILTANAQLRDLKNRECERALRRWQSRFSVKEQVQSILARSCPEFPTLEQVAQQLHTSRSCLYRKLQNSRTSYQCLINDFKRQQSIELLRDTPLPIHEIAERLGFSDASSFRRAFKNWTGRQPSSLRMPQQGARQAQ